MSGISASGRGIGGQNRLGLVVTDDAVSTWFVREILPLEGILMHYLRQNWRNASDIPDLRQEIYTRIFEAGREQIPDNPKRFLLTAARNHLINLVRREQVVPMETFADFEAFGIADEAPEPDRAMMEKEKFRIVKAALAQLPPRTREAIELSWLENLSGAETARRMNITQQAASELIANGILILGDIVAAAGVDRKTKS